MTTTEVQPTKKRSTRGEAPTTPSLGTEELTGLYRTMRLVRAVETVLAERFAEGEIPGFIHSSAGQEAVAVGVVSALEAKDTLASNHRGHGHTLARGVDLDAFLYEIFGRDEGLCRGRGGSMHVADLSRGMLGANGIVGAGIPIALGSALAHQVQKTGGVAAVFFGDGALGEGVIHESLNLAATWSLPVLFVCEHNGWSEFTPSAAQLRVDPEALARAYGIEVSAVDGNDVAAVHEATRSQLARARAGRPAFLLCRTHRHRGHFEGDPQRYRDEAELETTMAADPLDRCAATLRKRDVDTGTLDAEVDIQVAQAIERARAGSPPDVEDALRDVYTREEVRRG